MYTGIHGYWFVSIDITTAVLRARTDSLRYRSFSLRCLTNPLRCRRFLVRYRTAELRLGIAVPFKGWVMNRKQIGFSQT